MQTVTKIDPIKFEVIRNALVEATEEMAIALRRTQQRARNYEIAALSGVAYVLLKLDCEPAPMVLGFILGPMMEENLRRSMMISFGDPSVFITRPISAAFLIAAVYGVLVTQPRKAIATLVAAAIRGVEGADALRSALQGADHLFANTRHRGVDLGIGDA